jgi:hypothetical protein
LILDRYQNLENVQPLIFSLRTPNKNHFRHQGTKKGIGFKTNKTLPFLVPWW